MLRKLLIILLFLPVLLAFDCSKKKGTVPNESGTYGLNIPTSLKTFGRSDNGVMMFPPDYAGFDDKAALYDQVQQTVIRALNDERATALHYNANWTLPESKHVHIICLPPMFFTEAEHLPGLILRPNTGGEFYTAGTVINTGWRYTPNINTEASNPIIVIAYQENWDRLDYLYNSVYNEAEHVRERWQSFDEFVRWSGGGDVHPHRAPV